MDKVTLTLRIASTSNTPATWEFESLQFEDSDELLVQEDFGNAVEGAKALCFLMLMTAQQSSVGAITDSEQVKISKAHAKKLKPIWNGANNDWPKNLFGCKLFEKHLGRFGNHKAFRVYFRKHVCLVIEGDELSGISEEEKLVRWYRYFASGVKHTPEEELTIDILRLGKDLDVSSKSQESHLRTNDCIQILISSTFYSKFLVIWINSENDVHRIYPHMDIERRENIEGGLNERNYSGGGYVEDVVWSERLPQYS